MFACFLKIISIEFEYNFLNLQKNSDVLLIQQYCTQYENSQFVCEKHSIIW